MPRLYVFYHFLDRKGHKAQLRFQLPIALLATEEGDTLVSTIATALIALSNARLTRYEVVHSSGELDTPGPDPASSVYRRVSLFYGNGVNQGSILLPSPAALPFDATGPLAGIRLARDALLLSGMLANVEGIVEGTLLPTGEPFPTTFVVGGAAGGEL